MVSRRQRTCQLLLAETLESDAAHVLQLLHWYQLDLQLHPACTFSFSAAWIIAHNRMHAVNAAFAYNICKDALVLYAANVMISGSSTGVNSVYYSDGICTIPVSLQ